MFARFGFPLSLRTDNGPQFISAEFEAYLAQEDDAFVASGEWRDGTPKSFVT